MQITRNSIETHTRTARLVHGTVYIDPIATPSEPSQVDDQGSPVMWGEHVTDDEYNAAPAS